jgi:ribosomal protein L29
MAKAFKEIQKLNKNDLEKKLNELKFDLIKFRKDNGSKVKTIKKMIARILTLQNSREVESKE